MGGIEKMIEIEGLPEGFEINSVTINAGETISQCFNTIQATIHLKKIKPREITIIETEQDNIKHDGKWCNQHFRDGLILTQQPKYWRIKEE